jgi:hypothetical protein
MTARFDSRRNICCGILVSALLAACGGGGSGGSGGSSGAPPVSTTGNTPAPSTGPGDVDHYFPTAIGDGWQFDMPGSVNVNGEEAQASIAVTGTANTLGQASTVFHVAGDAVSMNPVDQYFAVSAGGVTAYGNGDSTDSVTPHIVPYAQLLFPVAPGPVSSVTVTNAPDGTDASGNPVTVSFTQTIAVQDLETLAVTGGNFSNVARVVTTIAGTATDSALQQSAPISGTDTVWFAPGVGQIQESVTSNLSGTTTTQTFAMRGYQLDGVSHALGSVATIQSNIALPGANSPGPAIASDGTNTFVAVATMPSTSGGSPGIAWTIFGPNGSPLTTTNTISTPSQAQPMAAFDGTNYELVYSTGVYGQTQSLYVQRIAPNGLLVDTQPYVAATSPYPFSGPLAAGNGSLLLLTSQSNVTAGTFQISGIVLSPAGTPPGNGAIFPISGFPTSGNFASQQLVFDGTNYFSVRTNNGQILGLHLSGSTGAAIESTPIAVAGSLAYSLQPSLLNDSVNGQYFIAWPAEAQNGTPAIYATRVSRAGVALDGAAGIQLSNTGSSTISANYPSVAFNGTEYLVTWIEASNTSSSVRGARVSPSGSITSGPGFELSVSLQETGMSLIASTPPSMSLRAIGGMIVWYEQNV